MRQEHLQIAEQYFAGRFLPPDAMPDSDAFAAKDRLFHLMYDDWYRGHYAQYGAQLDAIKSMVKIAATGFAAAYAHMPLCYKNCAISSGTHAHLDAVMHNHHTTERIDRVIGSALGKRNVEDNAMRSLARAGQVQTVLPHVYMVTPSAFEGGTRVFSKGGQNYLTGGMAFDGADYMSFWNMVIDRCTYFVLDDVKLDQPDIEVVKKEIELAQAGSKITRERRPLLTSDWTNSRNSILEMARGVYIRFGLHPLRPDAKMDMRVYDTASHSLQPAMLLLCAQQTAQNILRWVPQGIAAEEACRTLARLFHLHRMRSDEAYNKAQPVPLDLQKIDPVFARPSFQEVKDLNALMAGMEPFLLQYCAHLIRPEGLPEAYLKARAQSLMSAVKPGQETMAWQRANIPLTAVEALWPLTQPKIEIKAPLPFPSLPRVQRRLHEFRSRPFDSSAYSSEIFKDTPFQKLDHMQKELAEFVMGVLETGLLPLESSDYYGLRYDMKRGDSALALGYTRQVQDLSLLPGNMGAKFQAAVRVPNEAEAAAKVQELRQLSGRAHCVFGAPVIKAIGEAFQAQRSTLSGPGPAATSSDWRLAVEMEMLRRNLTHLYVQPGWETSDDSVRMLLQATKIEFGLVDRPAKNNTHMRILNFEGRPLSLFDRYEALRLYLKNLAEDKHIKKSIIDRDASAIEVLGVRHISVGLARLLEIYDALISPEFNRGRFEKHRLEHGHDFERDFGKIYPARDKTLQHILQHFVWLWDEHDFADLRPEYKDMWLNETGQRAQHAGPPHTDDRGVISRFGPG